VKKLGWKQQLRSVFIYSLSLFPFVVGEVGWGQTKPDGAAASNILTPLPEKQLLPVEMRSQLPPPQDVLPNNERDRLPETSPTLPPPEDLLPEMAPTEESPKPTRIPGTITVKKFEFEGNTAYSDEELQKITARFRDRPITFVELLQARSTVTKKYVDNGYITTGAYIPPQTIKDNTVTIQVVEGRLSEIKIDGTGHLQPSYIRRRLRQATEKPLNQDQLLEALQLLLLDPLVENISAELSAGTDPGTSLLSVDVEPANPWQVQANLNNGQSPSVGSFGQEAQIVNRNLTGNGDRLELNYTRTDGSNNVDAIYSIPINARNSTIRFRASLEEGKIIEEPFDQLDIEAQTQTYEVTFEEPLLETPTQELLVGLTASHERSFTYLLDNSFALSAASDQGVTKITTASFFQQWSTRGEEYIFAARSEFRFGLDWLDATDNETLPDSEFFTWHAQVQWLRSLGEDTLFLVRSDIQLATDPLLSSEQFGLGGLNSIRGYREDTLLTDSGVLVSAEVQLPVVRFSESSVLQVVPFFDIGTGWNVDANNPDPDTLVGTGLGLRWESNALIGRIDWGIPLVDSDRDRDSLQEKGIYFSLQWKPF
jgi:hemolysin activation/secretion protein